jgi:TolA-binding protein
MPEKDPWLATEEVALPAEVQLSETVEPEAITVRTSRPGHPLLVKVGYHPRWRAEGALGPYLASPALMLIVPQQETVRLTYARTGADRLGLAGSLGALLGAGAWLAARRRSRPRPSATAALPLGCDFDEASLPKPPWRWGMAVPIGILGALFAARLFHQERDRAAEARELYERASQAYARGQFEDAAELARHGAARGQGTAMREELLCLRGESLLRAGEAALAVKAFETLLQEAPDGPYTPQALFSGAEARLRVGDVAGAQSDRQRLREAYPETPWAQRLGASDGQ